MWKKSPDDIWHDSQESTHWLVNSHNQEMISEPMVTAAGPTGEQTILISSTHFLMVEIGASMHYLFVSSVLQCISSSAHRKTFSFTAVSATLSRLTPRKKYYQQYLKCIIKLYWFPVRKLEKDQYLSWHTNLNNIHLQSAKWDKEMRKILLIHYKKKSTYMEGFCGNDSVSSLVAACPIKTSWKLKTDECF